jgi:hypothetical protein
MEDIKSLTVGTCTPAVAFASNVPDFWPTTDLWFTHDGYLFEIVTHPDLGPMAFPNCTDNSVSLRVPHPPSPLASHLRSKLISWGSAALHVISSRQHIYQFPDASLLID